MEAVWLVQAMTASAVTRLQNEFPITIVAP